eukprot:scaffold262_cov164-Ochromonas_danica.AAC.11
MAFGRVEKWHCSVGSKINSYTLLLEVSTQSLENIAESNEPVHLDIEIIEDMILHRIIGEVGKVYSVGEPLAILCEEDISPEQLAAAKELSKVKNIYEVEGFAATALWQGYIKNGGAPQCGSCA